MIRRRADRLALTPHPGRRSSPTVRQALRLLLVAGWILSAGHALAQAELRIATEGAFPPFNYVEGSEPAGFEVDLARALCNAMGLPCIFVLQDWEGMIGGLKENRYDAVLSSMEITEERGRRVLFSKRYYRMPATLIGPRTSDGTEPVAPPDLAGKSVGVLADSEFSAYLEARPNGPDIRTYNRQEEANLDLLTGRIDYVLGDKLALVKFLATREGKACCQKVADPPVQRGEGVGVAVRRGDRGLKEMFDRAIDKVMADGTYDRVRAKWFPFDIR